MSFFEPLQLDIATVAELQVLLNYHRNEVELTRIIARINGLTEEPIRYVGRLSDVLCQAGAQGRPATIFSAALARRASQDLQVDE